MVLVAHSCILFVFIWYLGVKAQYKHPSFKIPGSNDVCSSFDDEIGFFFFAIDRKEVNLIKQNRVITTDKLYGVS